MESLGIPTRDGTAVETRSARDLAALRRALSSVSRHARPARGSTTSCTSVFGVRVQARRRDRATRSTIRSPSGWRRPSSGRARCSSASTSRCSRRPTRRRDALERHQRDSRVGLERDASSRPSAPTPLFRIATPGVARRRSTALARASRRRRSAICRIAHRRARGATRAISSRSAPRRPITASSSRTPAQLSREQAEALFRARAGRAPRRPPTNARFEAHMLMEMARMSRERRSRHAAARRRAARPQHARRSSASAPTRAPTFRSPTEYTRNLRAAAQRVRQRSALHAACSSRSTNRRTRASSRRSPDTIPRCDSGPPWWFHDSIEGMTRYREQVTETAGIYNTAGLQRRHARVLLDPRAPRSLAARRRELPRADSSRGIASTWTTHARWRARSRTISRRRRIGCDRRRRRSADARRATTGDDATARTRDSHRIDRDNVAVALRPLAAGDASRSAASRSSRARTCPRATRSRSRALEPRSADS